jgi:inorganic phosphate transporter, PiT family
MARQTATIQNKTTNPADSGGRRMQRLGNIHLTPAQGASAELVSAALIGNSGFTGLPVSTTHFVTSGIAGTMVSSGAGLRYGMLSRIAIAWLVTLTVTFGIASGLYFFLESPTT